MEPKNSVTNKMDQKPYKSTWPGHESRDRFGWASMINLYYCSQISRRSM